MSNSFNQLIPDSEFQTVVPSNDGMLTVRSLNTESPSNSGLLNTYGLTPISVIPIIPFHQGTCFASVNELPVISTKEDLYIYLCDVLIRFDSNPNYYQREDYRALLRMLVGTLSHVYDVYAKPVSYHITTSPEVLSDIIPTGHLVKNIMIYNNESFSMNVTLGYTVDGEEFFSQETVDSHTWLTLTVNKLISVTSASSVYFNSDQILTSNGVYVVVDSNFCFSS